MSHSKIFNLNDPNDMEEFMNRVNKFVKNRSVVELSIHRQRRTLPQNSYLHLLLSYFGSVLGYDLKYVKDEIFKKIVNKEIFYAEAINKRGVRYRYLRSSSDLNTKEMTIAIERFRNYSSMQAGLYLPEANEKGYILQMEKEIYQNKEYL